MLTYEELVLLGTIKTSPTDFAALIRNVQGHENDIIEAAVGAENMKEALRPIRLAALTIKLASKSRGIGYLPSSLNNNRKQEVLFSSLIANAFSASNVGIQPLVISIKDFYNFSPTTLSFVIKTEVFNRAEYEQYGKPQHALIVSDFADFDIFSDKILQQVPSQTALGLDFFKPSTDSELKKFGEKLLKFNTPLLELIQVEGSFENAVARMFAQFDKSANIENLKILLATVLLLQDQQKWQDLWYEGQPAGGVPLYIIAPACFHDAMNRVNLFWGHGGMDYHYRASNSLGASWKPPYEMIDGQLFL